MTKVHNSPQRAQRFTEFFYFFRGVAVNHGLFRLVTWHAFSGCPLW
ncbi:hypothetical protein HMPREF9445_02086 [Bacteroides clarus YIT 12056]|uniref:Uncharacterized protein n=1 Tax=Bacteroides clarus YIT 12056 TaxID=762984 RepID=A0ABP2KRT9_9BACE|nr:hypothetical protein HMPREF9445_02086 [Bacteroides clarus YIT 12056]